MLAATANNTRQRAREVDEQLGLLAQTQLGEDLAIALIAVGGYGRGELCRHSDIDLLVVTSSSGEINQAALRGLLYPLWDKGYQVGHALVTPKQAVQRASKDLHAATALTSARLVAGSTEVYQEVVDRFCRWTEREKRSLVAAISAGMAERHSRGGRAGWALAPDLKDDAGGLRDVHACAWARVISGAGVGPDDEVLASHGETLLSVRDALHLCVPRKTDRLRIDLQPQVAEELGLGRDGVDELMRAVHFAARRAEHISRRRVAELKAGSRQGPRRSGSTHRVGDRVTISDGVLEVSGEANTYAALQIAAAVSTTGAAVAPGTFKRFEARSDALPFKWDTEAVTLFLELLRGPHAVRALETIDHMGALCELIPEWRNIEGLAQHDPYHRYTVDGHSFRVVEQVTLVIGEDGPGRTAAGEAGDLDSLYLAAMLHDCGKGSGRDHSVAGEELARSVCERMRLPRSTIDEVAALVRLHLLLPDTAMRRDLDDGAVIVEVADRLNDARLLRLAHILAIADGRATGPDAWNEWKAALVHELFAKTLVALETGQTPARNDLTALVGAIERYEPALSGRAESLLEILPGSYVESVPMEDMADELRMLALPLPPGELRHRISEGPESGYSSLTLTTVDRPGVLARTAGVLSLHRLSVVKAHAYSTTDGRALQRFLIPNATAKWDEVIADLERAFGGRLALEARLKEKIRDYGSPSPSPDVRVIQGASEHSTVVEVRAEDTVGLLYAITSGLTQLDVDIHVAKIDTQGSRVIDVFYVRTAWGSKLDEAQAEALTRTVEHRISSVFS